MKLSYVANLSKNALIVEYGRKEGVRQCVCVCEREREKKERERKREKERERERGRKEGSEGGREISPFFSISKESNDILDSLLSEHKVQKV